MFAHAPPRRIVWLDLETTGLPHASDQILAIGVIVTDERLNEIARVEYDLHFDRAHSAIVEIHPVVQKMHTDSGLWDRCEASTLNAWNAGELVRDFLEKHAGGRNLQLAGNSVYFDLGFLWANMPRLANMFAYRLLDVTTLKVIASIWAPTLPAPTKEKANHTPLRDLEESIAELRHWDALLFAGMLERAARPAGVES